MPQAPQGRSVVETFRSESKWDCSWPHAQHEQPDIPGVHRRLYTVFIWYNHANYFVHRLERAHRLNRRTRCNFAKISGRCRGQVRTWTESNHLAGNFSQTHVPVIEHHQLGAPSQTAEIHRSVTVFDSEATSDNLWFCLERLSFPISKFFLETSVLSLPLNPDYHPVSPWNLPRRLSLTSSF